MRIENQCVSKTLGHVGYVCLSTLSTHVWYLWKGHSLLCQKMAVSYSISVDPCRHLKTKFVRFERMVHDGYGIVAKMATFYIISSN